MSSSFSDLDLSFFVGALSNSNDGKLNLVFVLAILFSTFINGKSS